MSSDTRRQVLIFAFRTAMDYVLTVLYGSLGLFVLRGSLRLKAGYIHTAEFWGELRYGYYLTTSFYFRAILFGLVLFAGAWGLQRLRAPRILIGMLGAVAAAVLSFFMVYVPTQSPTVPMPFLLGLGYLPIPIPPLLGLLFGAFILPRRANPEPSRLAVRHWVILLPAVLMGIGTVGSFSTPQAYTPKERPPQTVFITWDPAPEPLTIKSFDMPGSPSRGLFAGPARPATHISLTDRELDLLRLAGAAGKMTVQGGIGDELTTRGRVVLILHQQVQEPFAYDLPAGDAAVIYWQSSTGWQKLPADAPASGTKGHLFASPDHPNVTCYDVDTVPPHSPMCRYLVSLPREKPALPE